MEDVNLFRVKGAPTLNVETATRWGIMNKNGPSQGMEKAYPPPPPAFFDVHIVTYVRWLLKPQYT